MKLDIHGNKLSNGDEVLVYQQKYQRTQESDGVWNADQNAPLPVADIPMARGTIEWDEDLLTYLVRYNWVANDWEGKAAAPMGGGEYAYERIGNSQ